MAAAQTQAVMGVLGQLEVEGIPVLTVWNKARDGAQPGHPSLDDGWLGLGRCD